MRRASNLVMLKVQCGRTPSFGIIQPILPSIRRRQPSHRYNRAPKSLKHLTMSSLEDAKELKAAPRAIREQGSYKNIHSWYYRGEFPSCERDRSISTMMKSCALGAELDDAK